MKYITNKTLIASMVTAAMGIGMVGTANAGATAYSALHLDTIQLFLADAAGANLASGQVTQGVDGTVFIDNRGSASAFLTSIGASPGANEPSTPGDVNLALQCIGSGCATSGGDAAGNPIAPGVPFVASGAAILDNDYRKQAVGHFSRSDGGTSGAIINGLAVGVPTSAIADTVAEVQLTSTDSGNSDSDVGTTSTTDVIASGVGHVRLDFNAFGVLESMLHQPLTSASANYNWSVNITAVQGGLVETENGVQIMDWSPQGDGTITVGTILAEGGDMNDSTSVLGFAGTDSDGFSGFFSVLSSVETVAGQKYRIVINHNSFVAANATKDVPEPATLVLMGLGLLGIAARRRLAKAKV